MTSTTSKTTTARTAQNLRYERRNTYGGPPSPTSTHAPSDFHHDRKLPKPPAGSFAPTWEPPCAPPLPRDVKSHDWKKYQNRQKQRAERVKITTLDFFVLVENREKIEAAAERPQEEEKIDADTEQALINMLTRHIAAPVTPAAEVLVATILRTLTQTKLQQLGAKPPLDRLIMDNYYQGTQNFGPRIKYPSSKPTTDEVASILTRFSTDNDMLEILRPLGIAPSHLFPGQCAAPHRRRRGL